MKRCGGDFITTRSTHQCHHQDEWPAMIIKSFQCHKVSFFFFFLVCCWHERLVVLVTTTISRCWWPQTTTAHTQIIIGHDIVCLAILCLQDEGWPDGEWWWPPVVIDALHLPLVWSPTLIFAFWFSHEYAAVMAWSIFTHHSHLGQTTTKEGWVWFFN